MELTVYADVLFVTNFLMDLVILFLTMQLSRIRFSILRLSFACLLMALYGTISFLPELSFLLSFLGRSLVGGLAILILSPKGGWLGFLKARMVLSLVSAGMGGVVYALATGTELGRRLHSISVNGNLYFLLDIRLLLLGVSLSYLLLLCFKWTCVRNFSKDNLLLPLEVTVDGKKVTLTALADTGCELTAPVTGEGVLLVLEKVLDGIVPQNSFWLTIHTAGGDSRIPAFYPDEVVGLGTQYQVEEIPLIGIVKEKFSRDDLYSGVFNPKILEEKGGRRNVKEESAEVLHVLVKNFAKRASLSSQRGTLYRGERGTPHTPWEGRGGEDSCLSGHSPEERRGTKNPYREKSAAGGIYRAEV